MATDFGNSGKAEEYSIGVAAEELTLKPVVMKVIGDVRGRRVLDLGCGDGRYSVALAEKGAIVKAIDPSAHQINIARKKNSHNNVHYIVLDGSGMPGIMTGSMDMVLMNMVVPDIREEGTLLDVLSEAARVLKGGGRMIISNTHPLYLSPDQDPSDRPLTFRAEDYFMEGHVYRAEARLKNGKRIKFIETHFSLSFLSEKLEEAGFLIKRIHESRILPERKMCLPKYIILECVKK